MSLLKPRSWLLVTALLLAGASDVLAQPPQSPVAPQRVAPGHWLPFAPMPEVETDARWFAEAELSEYGCDRPDVNEGFFFQYDRLVWAITGPKRTEVGSQEAERVLFLPTDPTGFTNQTSIIYNNDVDTFFIENEWVWGNRFEFGYVVDDTGWLFSGFHIQTQDRRFDDVGAQIAFNDPFAMTFGFVDLNGDLYDDDLNGNGVFGRAIDKFNDGVGENWDLGLGLGFPANDAATSTDFADRTFQPVYFDTLVVQNKATMFGTELMKIWRLPRLHYGGVWEWMAGVRYMNMTEEFDILGTGGILGEFLLDSRVNNHIVGPQIAARWHRQTGRWTVSSEGRFTAGVNFQQARVEGHAATLDPNQLRDESVIGPAFVEASLGSLDPFVFSDARSDETFAPIGELRLETQYQLTKAISLRGGYAGLVSGGVGRASRRIDYTIPNISIREDRKAEALIVNGFNFGVVINR